MLPPHTLLRCSGASKGWAPPLSAMATEGFVAVGGVGEASLSYLIASIVFDEAMEVSKSHPEGDSPCLS